MKKIENENEKLETELNQLERKFKIENEEIKIKSASHTRLEYSQSSSNDEIGHISDVENFQKLKNENKLLIDYLYKYNDELVRLKEYVENKQIQKMITKEN
jgi:hypothetical protein